MAAGLLIFLIPFLSMRKLRNILPTDTKKVTGQLEGLTDNPLARKNKFGAEPR